MVAMIEPMTKFSLESPGGEVRVSAECQNGRVIQVTVESMPSFVGYMNKSVLINYKLLSLTCQLCMYVFYRLMFPVWKNL